MPRTMPQFYPQYAHPAMMQNYGPNPLYARDSKASPVEQMGDENAGMPTATIHDQATAMRQHTVRILGHKAKLFCCICEQAPIKTKIALHFQRMPFSNAQNQSPLASTDNGVQHSNDGKSNRGGDQQIVSQNQMFESRELSIIAYDLFQFIKSLSYSREQFAGAKISIVYARRSKYKQSWSNKTRATLILPFKSVALAFVLAVWLRTFCLSSATN